MAQETNNHVLQICPRAHKARIDKHDAVLSYLGRNIRRQGFEIQKEPHYRTQEGLRKPGIVATMGTLGLVIDVKIFGEQSDLERARTAKIRRYADNPDIEQAIQRETGATNIRHLPVILSWRGIWCKTSASDFLTRVPSPGGISLSSPPVCSSVVLSPTATSIAQPRSRSEDDIAQKKTSHSLGAACHSQAQPTLNKSCTCNECSIKL